MAILVEGLGWTVRRFWEHEDADDVAAAITGAWTSLRAGLVCWDSDPPTSEAP